MVPADSFSSGNGLDGRHARGRGRGRGGACHPGSGPCPSASATQGGGGTGSGAGRGGHGKGGRGRGGGRESQGMPEDITIGNAVVDSVSDAWWQAYRERSMSTPAAASSSAMTSATVQGTTLGEAQPSSVQAPTAVAAQQQMAPLQPCGHEPADPERPMSAEQPVATDTVCPASPHNSRDAGAGEAETTAGMRVHQPSPSSDHVQQLRPSLEEQDTQPGHAAQGQGQGQPHEPHATPPLVCSGAANASPDVGVGSLAQLQHPPIGTTQLPPCAPSSDLPSGSDDVNMTMDQHEQATGSAPLAHLPPLPHTTQSAGQAPPPQPPIDQPHHHQQPPTSDMEAGTGGHTDTAHTKLTGLSNSPPPAGEDQPGEGDASNDLCSVPGALEEKLAELLDFYEFDEGNLSADTVLDTPTTTTVADSTGGSSSHHPAPPYRPYGVFPDVPAPRFAVPLTPDAMHKHLPGNIIKKLLRQLGVQDTKL